MLQRTSRGYVQSTSFHTKVWFKDSNEICTIWWTLYKFGIFNLHVCIYEKDILFHIIRLFSVLFFQLENLKRILLLWNRDGSLIHYLSIWKSCHNFAWVWHIAAKNLDRNLSKVKNQRDFDNNLKLYVDTGFFTHSSMCHRVLEKKVSFFFGELRFWIHNKFSLQRQISK